MLNTRTYLRRRLATEIGRVEAKRFVAATFGVCIYTGLVTAGWVNDLLATNSAQWVDAWSGIGEMADQIWGDAKRWITKTWESTVGIEPDYATRHKRMFDGFRGPDDPPPGAFNDALVKAAGSTMAATGLLWAVPWTVTAWRNRPWRYHSGGAHLAKPVVVKRYEPTVIATYPRQPTTAPVGPVADATPPKKTFRLFGPNPGAHLADIEVVAAFCIHAPRQPISVTELARLLGMEKETLRSRVRRATNAGWLTTAAVGQYKVSDDIDIDLAQLIGSVQDHDLDTALSVAAGVGPELPGIEAEWLDQATSGPTPRQDLTDAIQHVLADAADLWPDETTFGDAANRVTNTIL